MGSPGGDHLLPAPLAVVVERYVHVLQQGGGQLGVRVMDLAARLEPEKGAIFAPEGGEASFASLDLARGGVGQGGQIDGLAGGGVVSLSGPLCQAAGEGQGLAIGAPGASVQATMVKATKTFSLADIGNPHF